jgi:hypothetical protein
VVAVVKRGSEIHVLLVRPTADGDAFLEDVTYDLTKQAGRPSDAGLAGLSVDTTSFASDGVIKVASTAKDSKAAPTALGAVSVIALITDEASRAALPQEGSRVVDVVPEGRGPARK